MFLLHIFHFDKLVCFSFGIPFWMGMVERWFLIFNKNEKYISNSFAHSMAITTQSIMFCFYWFFIRIVIGLVALLSSFVYILNYFTISLDSLGVNITSIYENVFPILKSFFYFQWATNLLKIKLSVSEEIKTPFSSFSLSSSSWKKNIFFGSTMELKPFSIEKLSFVS